MDLKNLQHIIKCERAREFRKGGRTCGQRHGIGEPATQTSRISLDFCIGFFLIVLIILGSHEDVLHITYFVSFLHDVLNLFLGLHQTLSQTMD